MSPPYRLHYWPNLPGRGELVRMVLVEAGVPWVDVARDPDGEGAPGVAALLRRHDTDLPPLAPPVLEVGDRLLAQTPAICAYLAARHGLRPADALDAAQAHQVFLTAMDLLVEAHDTHHPLAVGRYYEDQREAAVEAAAAFREARLPKFVSWFDRVLGRHAGPWVFGEALTYADLGLAHVVDGVRYAFPRASARVLAEHPRVAAHAEAVLARPRIAAHRASDAWIGWNEDGIFRHHPELDD